MARSTFGRSAGSWRTQLLPWTGVAFLVLIADQIAKLLVIHSLGPGERLQLFPGLDLTLVYNRGAAFSFLAGQSGWQRWLFLVIGIAAVIFILFLLGRHGSQRLFAAGLALILGGALGNLLDRVVHGRVTDFILAYWHNWYFPAFNVADSAITVGVALLILDELIRVRRSR